MRREDWHQKMWHAIEQHREVPFDWATANCCTFAARVWDAMTDGDTVTQVAACHPDELGALRHIRDCGGLGPALERIYGPTVPGRAQRGDLVLIDTDNGPAAGIGERDHVAWHERSGRPGPRRRRSGRGRRPGRPGRWPGRRCR